MSWRSVFISQPSKLSLQAKQLLIWQGSEVSIPLEDIAVIVIDSREVLMTVPLLSALAEYGITLIVCDEQFLPCGQFLPFSQHSRFGKILALQMALSDEFKATVWQKIIRQKIVHQAFVLQCAGQNEERDYLQKLATSVLPNDETRIEAHAAAIYFPAMFGNGFSRRMENHINIRLNYGYSIIRSAMARALVGFGFLPALGLWHKSELNAFNLADDCMEIFRPLVDLEIYTQMVSGSLNDVLTTGDKAQLVKLLNYEILLQKQKHNVLSAMEQMAKSLQTAMVHNNPELFRLPEMIFAQEYSYE